MKKALLLLLVFLMPLCALGEGLGLDADLSAEVLDFDAAGIQVTDAQALAALIDQMPNLREVRMYDSQLSRKDMEWLIDT